MNNKPHPNLVGQTVEWFPHADRNAGSCAAIVTGQRRGALDLSVVNPGSSSLKTKNGVLHVDDPDLKRLGDNAVVNGGWDYTPYAKAIQERFDELDAKLQSFQEMIEAVV